MNLAQDRLREGSGIYGKIKIFPAILIQILQSLHSFRMTDLDVSTITSLLLI
jgi:hypothetical protein